MPNQSDVLIIGGGLAGLTAATRLYKRGFSVNIIEATDRVGGRIKTDLVNGFRLDRGFQVLLTAYPEAKLGLNYAKLNLKSFLSGAMLHTEKGVFELADPWRNPESTLATLTNPIGTWADKLRMLLVKAEINGKDFDEIFSQLETPTAYALQNQYHFKSSLIDKFLSPFLSGIFLEKELDTSNRMFDFVFQMLSSGQTAIPALGMEEIPKQLANQLPDDAIFTNERVVSIHDNKAKTESGEEFEAKSILIATEPNEFSNAYRADLLNTEPRSTSCLYFAMNKSIFRKPILGLNSLPDRLVNHFTVISDVSYDYAPIDKSLLSISTIGIPDLSESQLIDTVRREMSYWYGTHAYEWEFLKRYDIPYALPDQRSVKHELSVEDVKIHEGLYRCGDYLLNGSINAAMRSGRLAAQLIGDEW